MLFIKEEIFRGQLLSLLSLQYTDGEQHGVCGETKYLKSEVSGGIGVYFHLGNCEISVLQYCAAQRFSQPGGNFIEIDLSRKFLLAKPYKYEDISICLFNKQDTQIHDHNQSGGSKLHMVAS